MSRVAPDGAKAAGQGAARPAGGMLAELKARAEELTALAASYGASRLRVFGSVSRGEDTAESDVGLLVVLPPGYDFCNRIGVAAG